MSKHSSRLAIQQPAPCPAVPAELADEALWMGSAGLAKLAEIDESNASKALLRGMNGKAWRGNVLTVRSIDMGKGRGGKSLQVYGPSLPADLRDTWHTIKKSAPAEPVSAPIQRPMPTHFDLSIGTRVAEMRWKLAIVAPALAQPKRSEARAAMLRENACKAGLYL